MFLEYDKIINVAIGNVGLALGAYERDVCFWSTCTWNRNFFDVMIQEYKKVCFEKV
jgi:hypothetical protein